MLISKQSSVRGSLLSGLGELVTSSLVTEEYFILINHRVSQEILFFQDLELEIEERQMRLVIIRVDSDCTYFTTGCLAGGWQDSS